MEGILARLAALRGGIDPRRGLSPRLADELLDVLQTLVLTLLNEQALAQGEPCDADYVAED